VEAVAVALPLAGTLAKLVDAGGAIVLDVVQRLVLEDGGHRWALLEARRETPWLSWAYARG
jgi:hypothetical protein